MDYDAHDSLRAAADEAAKARAWEIANRPKPHKDYPDEGTSYAIAAACVLAVTAVVFAVARWL